MTTKYVTSKDLITVLNEHFLPGRHDMPMVWRREDVHFLHSLRMRYKKVYGKDMPLAFIGNTLNGCNSMYDIPLSSIFLSSPALCRLLTRSTMAYDISTNSCVYENTPAIWGVIASWVCNTTCTPADNDWKISDVVKYESLERMMAQYVS